MNTVKMLKTYARAVSADCWERMPGEMVHSVMVANNRILAAAVIQNGGKLHISTEAIHEMITATDHHLIAVAEEDGSLTVSLAPKEAILATPEMMAL